MNDPNEHEPEPEPIPAGVDGQPLGGRFATCRHCARRVAVLGGRFAHHTRPEHGDHCRDSGRPVTA